MTLFKPNFLQVYTAPRMLTFLLEDTEYFDFDVYLPTIEENLQRPMVWESEAIKNGLDKFHYHRLLIDNIFNYINIGKVVLYENSNVDFTISVLDGKQRINAILDYFNNKFGVIRDCVEYFFKDLDKVDQINLKQSKIDVCVINERTNPLTDIEKIKMFLTVNFAGVPQNSEHITRLQKFL